MEDKDLKNLENKLNDLDKSIFKLIEHQTVNDERMNVLSQKSQDVSDKIDFFMGEIRTNHNELKDKLIDHDHIIKGNGNLGLDEQVRNLNTWKKETIYQNKKVNKQIIFLGFVLLILLFSVFGQTGLIASMPDLIKLFF